MDPWLLARFGHLVGLALIAAGLIAVFVCDLRARPLADLGQYAQMVALVALFYDGLVVPGALLLLASGTWLLVQGPGWGFLETPWLVGMVGLFAFEAIEGNTVTRLYFRRVLRLARAAAAEGRWTAELVAARGEALASFTHFLDLPILMVIVALGVFRPADWTTLAWAVAAALTVATALNLLLPRLHPWGAPPR